MANATTKRNAPKAKTEPVEVKKVEEQRGLTEGVIAIDNGGFNVKVFTLDMETPWVTKSEKWFGHDNFSLQSESNQEGTYKIRWNDKIYFFGMLGLQSRRKLSGRTNTKSTDFFIIDILRACALKGYDINYVITSAPISRYSEGEINLIKDRLIGFHNLEINGEDYEFEIRQAEVAPETSIASFLEKPLGTVRWLDLASRTIGYGSTYGTGDEDNPVIPIEGEDVFTSPSGTIEDEGLSTRSVLDRKPEELQSYLESYVENIYDQLSPVWDDHDKVMLIGGGAKVPQLVDEIIARFPNAEVVSDPLTIQVRAMLEYATYFNLFGLDENVED